MTNYCKLSFTYKLFNFAIFARTHIFYKLKYMKHWECCVHAKLSIFSTTCSTNRALVDIHVKHHKLHIPHLYYLIKWSFWETQGCRVRSQDSNIQAKYTCSSLDWVVMVAHHSCGYVDKLSDRKIDTCSVTRDGLHLAVQVFAIQRNSGKRIWFFSIAWFGKWDSERIRHSDNENFIPPPIDDILRYKLIRKFIAKI